MNFPFSKAKKITSVADAIAPLQKIVEDLNEVSKNQHESVANTQRTIDALAKQKAVCEKEAKLADEQVAKMSNFFGLKPSK